MWANCFCKTVTRFCADRFCRVRSRTLARRASSVAYASSSARVNINFKSSLLQHSSSALGTPITRAPLTQRRSRCSSFCAWARRRTAQARWWCGDYVWIRRESSPRSSDSGALQHGRGPARLRVRSRRKAAPDCDGNGIGRVRVVDDAQNPYDLIVNYEGDEPV